MAHGIGFFCWNDDEPQGHIDVDWFQHGYDGPKSKAKCPNPEGDCRENRP